MEKQRHYFVNKSSSSQGYGFSCGHVWMWELDCEESWAPKNWCFWAVVLEKTVESPLDCKEMQPVHSEGGQPWDFFGRNDAKAEATALATSCKELTNWKKTLMLGGIGGRRWRGRQRMRWLDGITDSSITDTWWTWVWVNSGSWWWTERLGVLRFMGSQRVRHNWAIELNWTEAILAHREPVCPYLAMGLN